MKREWTCPKCGADGHVLRTDLSDSLVCCEKCAFIWRDGRHPEWHIDAAPPDHDAKPHTMMDAALGARIRLMLRGEEWTITNLYNLAHRMRQEQPADWIFICRLAETIAGVLT